MAVPWIVAPVVLFFGFIFLAALAGSFLALRKHRQRDNKLPGAGPAPAVLLQQPVSPPPPEAKSSHCPVCNSELPDDTPQGLCPQCLMQCALSASDQGVEGVVGPQATPYPSLPVAPAPADLAPHFPDLEILELLGQGGMGAVYKARQKKLDRLVALKVLPSEWGTDPAFAERFGREARALARLNHPAVVGVHDFGEAGKHFFLIMEFVDGVNLRQLLTTGRLQPMQALPLVAQICDALQYAHEQGVVHRDIKPENILVDKRGRVKIADFGLAKLLRRSRNEFTLTGSRQVMGTADYMAPEQRTNPQEVDHRADIFSLGVVFYEMLTGELPIGRFAAPSAKAGVDSRLDEIVYRALEREPDRRYQKISAIKADVESVLRSESWQPAVPGLPDRWEPVPAMVQLQTAGPAAGLGVVAVAILVEAVALIAIISDSHARDLEVLGMLGIPTAIALSVMILIGAVKLAKCRSYAWVMFATILAMLPAGYHAFVGIPIGIWVLRVLKRPEVQAVFALNLRRAYGAAPPLPTPGSIQKEIVDRVLQRAHGDASQPQPVPQHPQPPMQGGMVERRARSFMGSVFSMFLPRSAFGHRQEPTQPELMPAPAVPVPPRESPVLTPRLARRRGRAKWALAIVAVIMVFSWLRMNHFSVGHHMPPLSATVVEPEALQVEHLDSYSGPLALSPSQLDRIKYVLRTGDSSYQELERQHTQRFVNRAGHQFVKIASFAGQAAELEINIRASLDRFELLGPEHHVQLKKLLPPDGNLLPFGQDEIQIEMWRTGKKYHWEVKRSSGSDCKTIAQGTSEALPKTYRRFWMDPSGFN
jgi:tRNA A-37 threonylcarbamoyl transferase component Bud32